MKIKCYNRHNYYKKFIKRNGLLDVPKVEKTSDRGSKKFNLYEASDLHLIDELLKTNYLKKTDYIVDIGCGTGIFYHIWHQKALDI